MINLNVRADTVQFCDNSKYSRIFISQELERLKIIKSHKILEVINAVSKSWLLNFGHSIKKCYSSSSAPVELLAHSPSDLSCLIPFSLYFKPMSRNSQPCNTSTSRCVVLSFSVPII